MQIIYDDLHELSSPVFLKKNEKYMKTVNGEFFIWRAKSLNIGSSRQFIYKILCYQENMIFYPVFFQNH